MSSDDSDLDIPTNGRVTNVQLALLIGSLRTEVRNLGANLAREAGENKEKITGLDGRVTGLENSHRLLAATSLTTGEHRWVQDAVKAEGEEQGTVLNVKRSRRQDWPIYVLSGAGVGFTALGFVLKLLGYM